jgi:hypothetical protein
LRYDQSDSPDGGREPVSKRDASDGKVPSTKHTESPGVDNPLSASGLFDYPPDDSMSVRVDSTTGTLVVQSLNNFWGRGIRIVVTATDPCGQSDTGTVPVSINPVNDPPLLVHPPPVEIVENQTACRPYRSWGDHLTVPDDPDSAHSWRIEGHQHVSISYSDSGICFSAANNWSGTEEVHLIVMDPGGMCDTTGLTILILPRKFGEQIVSVPDSVCFVDSLFQYQVHINGRQIGDTSLVYTLEAPRWLAVSPSGLVHGIPRQPGEYPVSIRVFDQTVLLDSQAFSISVRLATGVAVDPEEIPSAFALYQNYPNPFNPTTTVAFDLPREVQVTLRVFDMLGREVAVLVHRRLPAGRHALPLSTHELASGAYLYRLDAETFTQIRKMMILK